MRRYPGQALAILALLLWSLSGLAQTKEPLPVASLLAGPDHADLPWDVQFLEPTLMYQQQYVLQIRTRIPAEILDQPGKQRVLHFAAKVQDGSGHWLPGIQYNKFEPTAKLGDSKDIECALAIYLRPGEYTVAMMAYESATGKSSITRRKIVIQSLSHDPLPELNAHLPVVEFPSEFPQDELSRTDKSNGELFPVGRQMSPMTIANAAPTRIDVVLNVSRQEDLLKEFSQRQSREFGTYFPGGRRPFYKFNRYVPKGLPFGRVMQTASLVSRLQLANGCTHVSAIDPLHMRIAVTDQPASEIDWTTFADKLEKLDQNTIDARVLQNHRGPGDFFHDYLEQLSGQANCDDTPAAAHYIIVVSSALHLPEYDKEMHLSDAAAERARFYYFQPSSSFPYGDDVKKMIQSKRTRRFSFSDPEELRKALAELIQDIRSGK